MSLQTHYRRDAAHSGAVVAARWRTVWMETVNEMGCCQDTVVNNYYTSLMYQTQVRILLQQLYLSYVTASLDVSVVFPGIPDFYDSDPGDAGDEVAQRNLALCLACESWVDEICNQGTSFIERTLQDAVPVVTGLVAVPFIPTLVTGFIALYAAFFGVAVHIELNKEAYRDYLKCAMYDKLKGLSTVDETGFATAFHDLPARPPPAEDAVMDDARDVIELWLRGVVNDIENWLGFISNLNAAMSVASTLSISACNCISCESDGYNFDVAMPDEVVFWTDPDLPAPPMGIWAQGVGGHFDIAGGEIAGGIRSDPTGVDDLANYVIYVHVQNQCPIERVAFRTKYATGGANRSQTMQFYEEDGTFIRTVYDRLHTPSGNWESEGVSGLSDADVGWVQIIETTRTGLDAWIAFDGLEIDYA